MRSGRNRFGGYIDGVSGGGTDGGGGRDIRDRDGEVLSRWEDNVAHVTVGTEINAPLTYALVLELRHPIMSTLGEPGTRLEREREGGNIEALLFHSLLPKVPLLLNYFEIC